MKNLPSHLLRFAALAAVVTMASCSKDEAESRLALVNDTPVTEETFRYWWSRDNLSADTPEARKALLERLIEREAMVQRATGAGLMDDPDFQEQVRSLLISRLKERELQPKLANIKTDESSLRARYESRSEELVSPERHQVAALWFQTRGQEPLEQRYKIRLEAVRHSMASSPIPAEAGFGSHSRNNSEHMASRYRGGVVGSLETGREYDPFRQVVVEIANSLDEGEISEVIVRPEGTFLVRLVKKEAAAIQSFESVRESLAKELRTERRRRAEAEFRAANLSSATIERFAKNLDALPDPLPAPVIATHLDTK